MTQSTSEKTFADYTALVADAHGVALASTLYICKTLSCTTSDVYRLALALKRETNNERGRPVLVLDGQPYFALADAETFGERFELERRSKGQKAN